MAGYPPTGCASTTFLGLPEWWFSVSAILGGIVMVFLLYAYFKGRGMMKRRERSTGVRSISCSICNVKMVGREEICPRCGSAFTGDRFLCPRCGKDIGKVPDSCQYCKINLRKVSLAAHRTKRIPMDPDIVKLKKGSKARDLSECPRCGALFDEALHCPVCRDRR